MRQTIVTSLGVLFLPALIFAGCAGAPSSPASAPDSEADSGAPGADSTESVPVEEGADEDTFQTNDSTTAKSARGTSESKIKATKTEAAMKFFVVNKVDETPMPGIVVSLTAPDGKKYYTEETDQAGYAEVLVPVGQSYEIVYVSLARKDVTAKVKVTDEPNQNIKLTLRYKKRAGVTPEGKKPGFVLEGIEFDTGKATIRPSSLPRLDSLLEFLTVTKTSRVEVSGHTDNVGKPASNKALSLNRARAVRDYLISKGVDGSRIEAVGYGDEVPMASNDDDAGRQKNRRIEATEL